MGNKNNICRNCGFSNDQYNLDIKNIKYKYFILHIILLGN